MNLEIFRNIFLMNLEIIRNIQINKFEMKYLI